jgi:uncharacterized membrane protein YphA (DoxX/SURF4 family)
LFIPAAYRIEQKMNTSTAENPVQWLFLDLNAFFASCEQQENPAGVVEVTCGVLIILGFLTRLAAIPLVIIMIVAIVSTKLPIWAGHDLWIFHAPKIARYGFWSMAHEARDDFLMLLGSLYLLIAGAGQWSVDAAPARRASAAPDARGLQRTREAYDRRP